MLVRRIMTSNPASCVLQTSLDEIARLMVVHDCSAIPVLDEHSRPLGVVTDRDITYRAVAAGKDPRQATARDVMTSPVATVAADESVEGCLMKMEKSEVRRLPVVDGNGLCCGMVTQGDIAKARTEKEAAGPARDAPQPGNQGPW